MTQGHVPWLVFSDEVAAARAAGKPIVALESTIIAHGMPYPTNVQTAREVEDIIRREGAVPATIAIIGGRIRVGLSEEELEFLGRPEHRADIPKVSRRDLAYVLAQGCNGATTVAATMICARLAGIQVFVTGGIGGVHRGAERTMDISADLRELAQTDVAVVCAGAKAILDLGLTLEYLETHGVPVVGYRTSEFPAFYCRRSGFATNFSLNTPEELALFVHTKWGLGLRGGVVIANPVPEADAMDPEEVESVIARALEEAEARDIRGKDVTPFLLDRVKALTGGRSLETNVALVKNNAKLGAQLAVALAAASKESF
ncbi:MAG: pseudouridine-5'-phosphate glycosidase [Alicyclobacillus macrosporangiidus]|uniref:pseudouridine-5'-phosphate glycosidase n=1 Tax=Alicyclobacillus macrosporangiidus TaxID=392015 RepID=UPI0026E9430B|nr:pseudouridine-5'-phosphate glycosidase [Alicyclobacillus macrosporangiidus]MCL6598266.1 pseudouridine-5'-phosphate glycosidase [Alicyclobacillus macrosporangiidus]